MDLLERDAALGDLEAALDPTPDEATRAELVERAERGCFVGASLTAKPVYSWSLV